MYEEQIGTLNAAALSERPRFRFVTVAELKCRPLTPWRVAKVVPGRGVVVIYGAPGSGKTFVTLDIGLTIAVALSDGDSPRKRWNGRRVKGGNVIYVTPDGSLRARVTAWLQHHGVNDDQCSGFRLMESSINLLDCERDLPALMASLRELRDELRTIDVVVIDTLNRAMPGGDENASADMGRMVAAAEGMEAEFGCVVIFVHHCGKDEQRGARGHTSLKGAVNAELSVRRKGDVRQLVAEKVRDGEDGETLLRFSLKQIDLGPMTDVDPEADADERWTSCVAVPVEGEPTRAHKQSRPAGKNQQFVLDALRAAVDAVGAALPASEGIPPGTVGVRFETLCTHSMPMLSGKEWRKRETIERAVEGLKDAGFVGQRGEYVWPL